MSLITVDELAEWIESGDDRLVICDVRFSLADHELGRREYETAHIPGAVFVDLHTELAGGSGGGRHPLPSVGTFTAMLESKGIGPGSFVVAYDASGGAIASRLWWMLRSIGHGLVAVLDGGMPAWCESGLGLSAESAAPERTEYPTPEGWSGTVDADVITSLTMLGGVTVIDSRAPDRYRGDHEPLDPRAGHIPGAINRFHAAALDADGYHLPTAELVQRFAGIGVSPIVYCGSGVTACHNLLAMSLAGITDGRLYPGSWSEWSSDPARPAATGDQP